MGCCLMTKSFCLRYVIASAAASSNLFSMVRYSRTIFCVLIHGDRNQAASANKRKDFFMNSKENNYLTTVVCVAFLIALDIILTRFLSIQTQFLRIGFGFIPVAVAGIAYGPVWGGICGAVGDILGMLIYPSGAYFPGFTLTAALTGVIFGLILYRKTSFVRVITASAAVCIILNLLLDTLWLDIMYGSGFIALLPARAVKCFINIPIYSIFIEIIWCKGISKIPQLRRVS